MQCVIRNENCLRTLPISNANPKKRIIIKKFYIPFIIQNFLIGAKLPQLKKRYLPFLRQINESKFTKN
jgi:hypothetical protein